MVYNVCFILLLTSHFFQILHASEVPRTITSGFNPIHPTHRELEKKAKNLNIHGKVALHMAQLQEILPSLLYEHIPYTILQRTDFSVQDDDVMRSKKYLRLALTLKTNRVVSSESLQKQLISCSFYQSFQHALNQGSSLPENDNHADYYLSTAQLAYWTTLSYDKDPDKTLQDKLTLLESADSHVHQARQEIHKLPNSQQMLNSLLMINTVIHSALKEFPPERLHELALDENTRLSLQTYDQNQDSYEGYIKKKEDLARDKFQKNPQSKTLPIDQIIKNYKKILKDKFLQQQKTTEQKLELILRQNHLALLQVLSDKKAISNQVMAKIHAQKMIQHVFLYQQFKFLGDSINEMKEVLAAKLIQITNAVQEEVKKQLANE